MRVHYEPQIPDPATDTPTSYGRVPEGVQPPMDFEAYKSTALRHPKQPLIYLPQIFTEITGPQLGPAARPIGELDNDLTRQHAGAPMGERIIVYGPRIRHRGQAAVQHADRDLAGQRRGSLPAQVGQTGRRTSIRTSPVRAGA